jgi:hypothetical protein
VLSVQINSGVVVAKIAAVHHAGGEIVLLTAFGPTSSVAVQAPDRAF